MILSKKYLGIDMVRTSSQDWVKERRNKLKKYYKVNVYSEYLDMEKYNQCIIVERGLLHAKEIVTNKRIVICDNKAQGYMYDYYVLRSDFKTENIVRYDELKEYIDNFDLSMFPIYSNQEEKQVKNLDKKK